MSKFTDILFKTRKQKNMTKADVAKKMGWTPMYYGRYENGYLIPSESNLKKSSDFLGISISDLSELLVESKESEAMKKAS